MKCLLRRALIASLLLLAGCGREIPAGSNTTPVILISIDTLRSDRLPVYGYRGIETPNIDRFREDAILFEHAYTHCPLTLPAHTSMLTGLLPADHGVRDNVGYRLEESVPHLPAVLKKNGYATGAAISGFVLRRETGLTRGFDLYDDGVHALAASQMIGRIQRAGAETISVAREWIAKQNGPFFFFLHLYEPHTPYEPPEPFKSKYSNPYDGEIAYADQLVGTFLEFLKERDLYDRALIFIVSDHGEGLREHGEDEHGMFVYRESIQIPLLVKLPRSRFGGETATTPAQLIDLVPTIIEQTASNAMEGLQGTSLIRLYAEPPAEPRTIYSETYYPRFHFGWSDLHSLTDGEFHFIQAPRPELYDLRSDPVEKKNVLTDQRRIYAAMKRAIEPLVREAEAPSRVDPEEAAKFAALGYLGSTVPTEPGEKLPDPKDKIKSFDEIRAAFTLFRDKQHEELLRATERLLAENSRMLDLWDLKSRALRGLGRIDEAIAAAQEALKLSPNSVHLAIWIANLSLEIGRIDDAEKHAELALKNEPAQAHETLARVWIARDDLERAEKEIRIALETKRDRSAALMTLARIEKQRERLEPALGHLDQAIAELNAKGDRHLMNLHFLRGDVLARLGRDQEAEQELRREIELFPDEPQAYKNLILLLISQDRLEEGTQLIHQLVKASPTPPGYAAACHVLQVIGDSRGVRFWARKGLERFPNDRDLKRYLAG